MPAAAANVPAAAVSPGAAGAGGVGRRGVSLARESLSEKISARIGVFILVRRRVRESNIPDKEIKRYCQHQEAMAAEDCALCIVGAGYAGLNAFNAAAEYLPVGAKVVVIDRGFR